MKFHSAVRKSGVNEATNSTLWVVLPNRVRCAGKRNEESTLRENNLFGVLMRRSITCYVYMSSSIPLQRRVNTIYGPDPDDIGDIFPMNSSSLDLTVTGPEWKRTLHAVLEKPASSPAAFLMHIFSTALIVTSAVVTVLETVPAFHSIPISVWFGVETSLVALFTVEYIARFTAWSGSWSALFHWMTCT